MEVNTLESILKQYSNLPRHLYQDIKYQLSEIIANKGNLNEALQHIDFFLDQRPRKLLNSEIDDILAILPQPKSSVHEVSQSIADSIKESFRDQLRMIVVAPLGIPDLINEITSYYEQALIKTGSMVGMWAASALGHPFTQLALNTFHTSGSATNVSYGVDRITELVNVSVNQKNPATTIYFKDHTLTRNDVFLKKKTEIQSITLASLVSNVPEIYDARMLEKPSWYENYKLIYGKQPRSNWVLRIKLDAKLLYTFNITINDICEKLEEQDESLTCIGTPLSFSKLYQGEGEEGDVQKWVGDPFVDVYPNEDMIPTKYENLSLMSTNNVGQFFLYNIVIPSLEYIELSGVRGIVRLLPINLPVLSIIKEEIPLVEGKNRYRIVLNEIKMIMTGVRVLNLIRLLIEFKIHIVEVNRLYVVVEMPVAEDPSKYMLDRIRLDEVESRKTEQKILKEKGPATLVEPSRLERVANVVYADTIGSNLKTLFARDDIDATRTLSNNVHEIYETLGIEATRSFLITEFWNIIAYQDIYIEPAHISILVDFMTSLGHLNGITFSGLKRSDLPVLQLASTEQSFTVLTGAAGMGKHEKITDITSDIIMGRKAKMGTGINEKFMNQELLREFESTYSQGQVESFKPEEISNDLDNLEGLEFSTNVIVPEGYEGYEEEAFAPIHPGIFPIPKAIDIPIPSIGKINETLDRRAQEITRANPNPSPETQNLIKNAAQVYPTCAKKPAPITITSLQLDTKTGDEVKTGETIITVDNQGELPSLLQQQIAKSLQKPIKAVPAKRLSTLKIPRAKSPAKAPTPTKRESRFKAPSLAGDKRPEPTKIVHAKVPVKLTLGSLTRHK